MHQNFVEVTLDCSQNFTYFHFLRIQNSCPYINTTLMQYNDAKLAFLYGSLRTPSVSVRRQGLPSWIQSFTGKQKEDLRSNALEFKGLIMNASSHRKAFTLYSHLRFRKKILTHQQQTKNMCITKQDHTQVTTLTNYQNKPVKQNILTQRVHCFTIGGEYKRLND